MEPKEEYHDPDYPEIGNVVNQVLTDEEKVHKIRTIVRREFAKELELKKDEAEKIDDQMVSARRLLHRLRYALVNNYYRSQRLQLTPGQIQDDVQAQTEPRAKEEASMLLRAEQRRMHPSLRKLLGKKSVDLDEIFKFRTPRNKVRKDYMAMASLRNVTVPAEGNLKSLRPDTMMSDADETNLVKNPASEQTAPSSKPKRLPRHVEPKINKKIVKLDQVARNQQKHRYRIIIGNTSKYAPPASAADRSTHKWLLYIRGPQSSPDLTAIVKSIVVRLHDTYAPHHIVTLDKPPFHISRRGWGEFPAKIELHFACPARNRPACLEHTIKLDRNYTGVQTLGAETIVDVWLYSDEEMVKYEFKEDSPTKPQNVPKEPQTPSKPPTEPQIPMEPQNAPTEPQNAPTEPQPETNEQSESWMNFFTKESTEVDVDQMLIRPIKKEQPDIENLIHTNHIDKIPTIKQEVNDFGTVIVKSEPAENQIKNEIPDEITNQTSPKKRIMKYMDPSTGKVYYLEMDVSLDISKVQEIVINSKGNTQTAVITPIKNGVKSKKPHKKGGISLLKPEVQSLLKTDSPKKSILKQNQNFTHIQNDHCYLGTSWCKTVSFDTSVLPAPTYKHGVATLENDKSKNGQVLYENMCAAAKRMTSCRAAVNYMFRKIALVSQMAGDADFVKRFPFVVENEQKYWKLDFVKRRHMEWSRAKLINRILTEHMKTTERIWRTKQILIYGRLHGYVVARCDSKVADTCDDWSSWYDLEHTRNLESNIRETHPNPAVLTSLTRFQDGDYGVQDGGGASVNLTDASDDELDVTSVASPVRIKTEEPQIRENLTVLPVDEEDRLRFLFVERICSEIGIELRNEDIGNGHSYSAVHAALLCAVKLFAEEIVRSSLAAARSEAAQTSGPALVWTHEWPDGQLVRLQHALAAIRGSSRLSMVAGSGLATVPHTPYAI